MAIRIQIGQETVSASLAGEIDHHAARQLRAQIDGAIIRARPRHLVLDFGGVSFMDSSGIGLVMGRYRAMSALDGDVRVINLSPRLKKVMRLAGLDRLVQL